VIRWALVYPKPQGLNEGPPCKIPNKGGEMPIVGMAVMIPPQEEGRIRRELEKIKGVEVYGSDGRGNLIVVLDCETEEDIKKLHKAILAIEGVITISGVYYHFEDEIQKAEKTPGKPLTPR